MADFDTRIVKPLWQPPMLTVGPPPHVHSRRTAWGRNLAVLAALALALVPAVYHFGLPALRVTALAAAASVAFESLGYRVMKRRQLVDDFHPLVNGVLLAFLLPAQAPWWLVAAGAGIMVFLGRLIFGGPGGPLCAPVLGWAILKISWPARMNINLTMLDVDLTYPLVQFKLLGAEALAGYSPWALLAGEQLGGLGASQAGALLLGGAALLVFRRLDPVIPLAYLAGVTVLAGVYHALDPLAHAPAWFHLLTGSTMLAAFFLAPDHSSSPVGLVPSLVFGLTAGAVTVVLRIYGSNPDAVPYAILLANFLTPLLDTLRPRPFGMKSRRPAP
jgi:electron transport complex protein RnfD